MLPDIFYLAIGLSKYNITTLWLNTVIWLCAGGCAVVAWLRREPYVYWK
jgi:hypothetical protein